MSIDKSVSEYLTYLKDINRSENTVTNNRVSLNIYINYMTNREINLENTLGFFHYLRNQPGRSGRMSPSTIWTRATCVKCFLKWLDEYKNIKYFDYNLINLNQPRRHRIIYLTASEFEQVVGSINTHNFEGKRLRAMIEVYMSTGCRLTEVLNMKINDIDIGRGEAVVRRKGGDWNTVFLNQRSKRWLLNYLNNRTDKSTYLWVTTRYGVKKLQANCFQSQIQTLKNQSNIGKNWSIHTLRHSFATHLMQNNANIRIVQELLGHRSLDSTMIYTHLSNYDLKKAHRKYIKVK